MSLEKQVNVTLPLEIDEQLEKFEKTSVFKYKTKNQWIRELVIEALEAINNQHNLSL